MSGSFGRATVGDLSTAGIGDRREVGKSQGPGTLEHAFGKAEGVGGEAGPLGSSGLSQS